MAEKVILVDDLDGTEATRRVRLGLDGEWRQLDLSDKNYDALMKALGKFWDKAATGGSDATSRGRRSTRSSRSGGSRSTGGRKPPRQYDREMLREWAAEKGITLGRGRPSYALLDEFEADVANGWQPQAA